jgi:hypothetical protein
MNVPFTINDVTDESRPTCLEADVELIGVGYVPCCPATWSSPEEGGYVEHYNQVLIRNVRLVNSVIDFERKFSKLSVRRQRVVQNWVDKWLENNSRFVDQQAEAYMNEFSRRED